MRLVLIVALLLAAPALAATGAAGPQWLPVCKDKDFHVGPYVWLHVGVDCEPGVWVEVCPPGLECRRVNAVLS